MAKVIHTIKGHQYAYDHKRIGGRVVCKYLGSVDGCQTMNTTTRLSDAPKQLNTIGAPRYASQEALDREIHNAYTRGGLGIKKIQTIFADELGLHPSRRTVENYLKGMGIKLRKRNAPPADTSSNDTEDLTKLAQVKESLAISEIAKNSKDIQIKAMKDAAINDAKEILRLKEALMNIRDKGRAPTDKEIEELIR